MAYSASSANRQNSARISNLPPEFHTIQDILDGNGPDPGQMINLVGMVKDFRLPVPTNGTDYKCALTLSDLSNHDSGDGIVLNIFRQEDQMPNARNRDIVMLLRVKIQRYKGSSISLISHFSTTIYVYTASQIPRPPRSAAVALNPCKRPPERAPTEREEQYVSYLYHALDKDNTVDDIEFQSRMQSSLNIKDKFALLQDVQDGSFYNIIAQVARDPFDAGDKTTLYVSDYTENKDFFHYTYEGIFELPTDSGGYGVHSQSSQSKQWHGPYGKRAIQITMFEPHASYVRANVGAMQWLLIKNIQVKYGHNGANLEGYLREDRGAIGSAVNVTVLETQVDPDTIDPRLKQALRRFREYKKQYKDELKKLEQATGVKRKAGDESEADELSKNKKPNSKARRRNKRRVAIQKIEEEENRNASELNQQIVCETHHETASTVSQILEPSFYDTTINGECIKLRMPFTCAKYLANVRVVDFKPSRLEDFALRRKINDFSALSDDDGSSSSEEEVSGNRADSDHRQHVWEWCFWLLLEDARPSKETGRAHPSRLWVAVGNADAQCLTGLDASDLRNDVDSLDLVREKLFTLWGDLEEHKVQEIEWAEKLQQRPVGDMPALDSEGEDIAEKLEKPISNTPFACCIRQYGVRVPEEDPLKSDAGDGKKWERVYGLFGTKISS